MEQALSADPEDVAVVSCDIHGHSSANGADQVLRVARINDIVRTAIRRSRPDQVIWSSGGDGGHVVFRGDAWQTNAMELIQDLLSWARADRVKLRITGHVGRVTSIWGADGRVQVVGDGINFAGWLLRQLTREGVVVSDVFRRVMAAASGTGIRFHHERVFLDRNSQPQLLYLVSIGDVESTWLDDGRNDHASLEDSLRKGSGWDVLYFAKRILQVNSKEKRVAAALERTARSLKPFDPDQENFLAPLWHDELTEMLKLGQLVERRPGEVICRYGDPGGSLFVILRGEVGVYNLDGMGLGGEATAKHVHRVGEVVGELAPALNRNRTADLIAMTDVALLSFNYDEISQRLANTAAERQFNLFIASRVLEHVSQGASYLVGRNRTGPLSVVGTPPRVRVGDKSAWRDALRTLKHHCELITVAGGAVDLELDHVAERSAGRTGLYVLVSGSVSSSGAREQDLDGEQCPVLWVDLPDLLTSPPAGYGRKQEPIKVLRIAAEGIFELELAQRLQLQHALERVVGDVPDQYEHQVYLCHSSEDKAVVRQIRERLERNEIKCWFDEDELPVGHSVARRMELGLKSSRYLLVCASANFKKAVWANRELDAVLHLDVEHRDDPKVLVLKLNDEDRVDDSIPLLYQGKKWLNYQQSGDFERLVKFLRTRS